MNFKIKNEYWVGIFVFGLLIVTAVFLLTLGGGTSFFARQTKYYTEFDQTLGLVDGAKVMLNGIRVGSVHSINMNQDNGRNRVEMNIQNEYIKFIKKSSIAIMETQGVLGDKYISINIHDRNSELLDPKNPIPSNPLSGFEAFFKNGDDVLKGVGKLIVNTDALIAAFNQNGKVQIILDNLASLTGNLNSISSKMNSVSTQNFQSSLKNLDQILMKINNGDGTLGALVNDPKLYEDLRKIAGGVNRNRVLRNFIRQAIEDTEEQD